MTEPRASHIIDGWWFRANPAVEPTEERLQRHVRAMGAMNRQLQAQLEGGGGAPLGTPSSQGGDLLATAGTAAFGTSTAGARRAATAGGWLEQLATGTDGATPFLVRRRNGRAFLIEGGYRREVRSGVIAAGLEEKFGAAREVKDNEFDRWTDGVPVEVRVYPAVQHGFWRHTDNDQSGPALDDVAGFLAGLG